MKSYCVRCKAKTEGSGQVHQNGSKYCYKSTCDQCGCKKCQFVSAQVGEGLLSKVFGGKNDALKYPGEKHLPGYNYCGPGTDLKKRLGDPKSAPVNGIDSACKRHDINYVNLRKLKPEVSKKELLQRTQMVDDAFINEVKKADSNFLAKNAIRTAFATKKLQENITGNPSFVGVDKGKDALPSGYPAKYLNLSGKGKGIRFYD